MCQSRLVLAAASGGAVPRAVALLGDRLSLAGSPLTAPGRTLTTITVGEALGSAGRAALAGFFLAAPFAALAVAMLWGAAARWRG